ncbi:MAG: ABC transporter permease [Actinomycetota bacterium]
MSTRASTTRRMATAIGNETVKGLRHGWGERLQILIEMPLFVIFVLLLASTVGQGAAIAETGQIDWRIDPRHAAWLFIGVAAFTYTYLHLQKMFWRLLAEIQSGTLEQTYLSPLPSWVHVVGGRVVAAVAETAIVLAVTFGVTSLVVRLDLHWRVDALMPLALLIVGAAGLALIVAGITLVWKRIQMLNDLILLGVFFFSGAVLPPVEMPGWADAVGTPFVHDPRGRGAAHRHARRRHARLGRHRRPGMDARHCGRLVRLRTARVPVLRTHRATPGQPVSLLNTTNYPGGRIGATVTARRKPTTHGAIGRIACDAEIRGRRDAGASPTPEPGRETT